MDLEISRCCEMARRRRAGFGRESEAELTEGYMRKWQERWSGSVKGRFLYQYFPVVKDRTLCSGLEVGHVMSQFLTGHGAFMHYLHRFAKSATEGCLQCGQTDTVEHVVFECEHLADIRKALKDLIEGDGRPWPCELRELVRGPSVYKAFENFANAAVEHRGRVTGGRPTP